MAVKGWTPAPYTIVKDNRIEEEMTREGIAKRSLLTDEQLQKLEELYYSNHDIKEPGMFYSIYSKDLEYRKKIHYGILDILKPTIDGLFDDYKVLYSLFVVKSTGEKETEFFVHQDPSYVDEYKYSPVHLWAPLVDITPDNGALCIVPRSHRVSYPYRNISFPPPFEAHISKMRPYMEPLYMNAGEALIFDPRLIHNSLPNRTDKIRVAALVGVVPKEAPLQSAYKDMEDPESKLEFYQYADDHFLTGQDFYLSCRCRPNDGTFAGYGDFDLSGFSWEAMKAMFDEQGIKELNLMPQPPEMECRMFGEPVTEAEKVG